MEVYLAKKDKKIKISFVDSFSAQEVTGSNVYVETPNHKILLDCGDGVTRLLLKWFW